MLEYPDDEDLIEINPKNYELASHMEDIHLKAGQSIIRDLMSGMYKTVYECHNCRY